MHTHPEKSSGLSVTFSVINGQAAVNDQQLTLLGEGLVTVRTIIPGSPLWLSASADQTFTVLPVGTQPQVVIDPPKPDGTFSLEIRAPVGVNLVLETTSDLSAWTENQRLTGQGLGNPVKVTLQPDPNGQARMPPFWIRTDLHAVKRFCSRRINALRVDWVTSLAQIIS